MGGSPTLSHLFTASTTGLPLRMSRAATSRSWAVTPRVDVGDHDDAVRRVDGQLGLLADVGQDAVGLVGVDAAGVHQKKLVVLPLARRRRCGPG